ncbi:hypothetical protein [Dactylosporangium sp. NPDC006015]|uniref:hypothetical protein n=1 Tax=Dactylosporangium sp. NPDC006015 TaxID=3154576 RepID=UPI0033AE7225
MRLPYGGWAASRSGTGTVRVLTASSWQRCSCGSLPSAAADPAADAAPEAFAAGVPDVPADGEVAGPDVNAPVVAATATTSDPTRAAIPTVSARGPRAGRSGDPGEATTSAGPDRAAAARRNFRFDPSWTLPAV